MQKKQQALVDRERLSGDLGPFPVSPIGPTIQFCKGYVPILFKEFSHNGHQAFFLVC